MCVYTCLGMCVVCAGVCRCVCVCVCMCVCVYVCMCVCAVCVCVSSRNLPFLAHFIN